MQQHALTVFWCLQQLSSVTDPEAATSEYNLVENIYVCLCLSHLPRCVSLGAPRERSVAVKVLDSL